MHIWGSSGGLNKNLKTKEATPSVENVASKRLLNC